MKKSRFTESQIIAVLKEGDAGVSMAELYRKHAISNAAYYNRKRKCTGEFSNSSDYASWKLRMPDLSAYMYVISLSSRQGNYADHASIFAFLIIV